MPRVCMCVSAKGWRLAGFLALAGCLTSQAEGQQRGQRDGLAQPRLFRVMPTGAKQGSTLELVCSGQDLSEAQGLQFSIPGVQVEVIASPPPPPPDPKQRGRGRGNRPPRPPSKFKVTLPANTPLGIHDVRVITKRGISNPRAFVVGDQNEIGEKEPNNDVKQAQRIDLNTVISGDVANPTDVDYFVFAGKKGQRIIASCLATSIDSRLTPGLELFDAAGKKLASNRGYQQTDALVDITLPADGDYHLRLFQFTYLQGGPDYFYRLTVSTAPWIDAVFPPVVVPGQQAQVTIYGANLPGGQLDPEAKVGDRVLEKAVVTIGVPKDAALLDRLTCGRHLPALMSGLDGFEYRMKNDAGSSNPCLLTFARGPVVLATGKNLTKETVQPLTLPCETAGWLDRSRGQAWFEFTAQKGETFDIEILGDRLGSTVDLAFTLYANGKQVVEQDDDPELLSNTQFYTRTTDPQRYRLSVPATGKYQLVVRNLDRSSQLGPRNQYVLRIAPPKPDFRMVVMPFSSYAPDCHILPKGGQQAYTVYVWRQGGFDGDIALSAEGLPAGITCKPQIVGTASKRGTLVLSAAPDAEAWTGEIHVKATATIDGQAVVHEARPASIVWPGAPNQNNVPKITRLDRSLILAVRDAGPFTVSLGMENTVLLQGEKLTIPLKVERAWADFKTPILVTALNLPRNMVFNNNNQPFTLAPDKKEGGLVLDCRNNVAPGTYSIVFQATATVPFSTDPKAKQKGTATVTLPTNPIVLIVAPKQVAKASLAPGNPSVKIGMETQVVVKVARQNNYGGELKVELIQPPGSKGIMAPEVTIPAGKNEATLIITADSEANPGTRTDLNIKVTAMFSGKAIEEKVKFNLKIDKP